MKYLYIYNYRTAINKSKATTTAVTTTTAEDKKVEKILSNPELRELLMDVNMQNILKECGNPLKFQQYMKDPVISKKIKLLMDNGLVGTE